MYEYSLESQPSVFCYPPTSCSSYFFWHLSNRVLHTQEYKFIKKKRYVELIKEKKSAFQIFRWCPTPKGHYMNLDHMDTVNSEIRHLFHSLKRDYCYLYSFTIVELIVFWEHDLDFAFVKETNEPLAKFQCWSFCYERCAKDFIPWSSSCQPENYTFAVELSGFHQQEIQCNHRMAFL